MKFSEIKQFTQDGYYRIDTMLDHFKETIERYIEEHKLNLCPDFQRGHAWTEEQQTGFVEYMLRGGIASDLRFNHPGWMDSFEGDFVCVDGLQRITALLKFFNNEIKAFNRYFSEYEGLSGKSIGIRINNLKTKKQVLEWYVDLNTGGTVHTKEEINKVKKMIKNLTDKEN